MKKKIAVLLGGISAERNVSLKTGKYVSKSLKKQGYQVKEIKVTANKKNLYSLCDELEKLGLPWCTPNGTKVNYHFKKHDEMYTYFNGIIKFMWAEDRLNEIPELLKQINRWDKVRSENMFEVFPELGILKD